MKAKSFNFKDTQTEVLCKVCQRWIEEGFADLDGKPYEAYYCHECMMNIVKDTFHERI